jgi:hypothetical protein
LAATPHSHWCPEADYDLPSKEENFAKNAQIEE